MAFGSARRALRSAGARWRPSPAQTDQVGRWGRVLGTALGIGAVAGAGQLGLGYGLGLLRFQREFASDGLWSAQLTWVAWFAILATLAGAAAASSLANRYGAPLTLAGKAAAAVVAGVGATVVAPLASLPASGAELLGRPAASPALEATLTAALGALVGVVAAMVVLTIRLAAVSTTLMIGVVWLLALISTAPSLPASAQLPEVRLAVLELPAFGDAQRIIAILTPPLLALLICGGLAAAARTRGLPPLQTASATAAAPALLAATYLIGSPGADGGDLQTSPYAGALVGVATGLLTSLLVGIVRLPDRGNVTTTDPHTPVAADSLADPDTTQTIPAADHPAPPDSDATPTTPIWPPVADEPAAHPPTSADQDPWAPRAPQFDPPEWARFQVPDDPPTAASTPPAPATPAPSDATSETAEFAAADQQPDPAVPAPVPDVADPPAGARQSRWRLGRRKRPDASVSGTTAAPEPTSPAAPPATEPDLAGWSIAEPTDAAVPTDAPGANPASPAPGDQPEAPPTVSAPVDPPTIAAPAEPPKRRRWLGRKRRAGDTEPAATGADPVADPASPSEPAADPIESPQAVGSAEPWAEPATSAEPWAEPATPPAGRSATLPPEFAPPPPPEPATPPVPRARAPWAERLAATSPSVPAPTSAEPEPTGAAPAPAESGSEPVTVADPDDEAEADPQATPEAGEAAAPEPKRRRQRHDEEHIDWITSLAGKDEESEPAKVRRRLKRDRED